MRKKPFELLAALAFERLRILKSKDFYFWIQCQFHRTVNVSEYSTFRERCYL